MAFVLAKRNRLWEVEFFTGELTGRRLGLRIGAGRLHHLSLVTALEGHEHVGQFDIALKPCSIAKLLVTHLMLCEAVLGELLCFDASFPAHWRI